MVGTMVVNFSIRVWGRILGTWYLVGLVSLKSLIQILRAVTLAIQKVKNGLIGDATSLSGRSERPESGTEGSGGDFHNFSIVDLPLVKPADGLSVVGLQGFHCTLTQQFEYLGLQIDRVIIPFEALLRS